MSTHGGDIARFAAIGGCVPLVTCNRTEIYFLCSREEAERILEKFAGKPLNFSFYGEEDAERHLFRLAAGLESMLIGEDEILGQIRKAYEEARNGGYAAGADALFQAAIACGKKVRSETSVSAYACSVATLAANEAFRFAKSLQKENAGADTEKPVALLVGATGGIGANVLKNLLSKNIFRIVATSRKHGGIATAEGVESADYSARYSLLDGADVVISATSSPHTVFGAAKVRKSLSTKKPRLFIDLSENAKTAEVMVEKENNEKEKVLEMNIDELELSVRSFNCLKRAGINTVDYSRPQRNYQI